MGYLEGAKTALDYGKLACDTMMKKFKAEDLPPKGRFHYHQGVFLSGMEKIYELCKEEAYYYYIKDWVDSIIDDNGNIHEFDSGQMDDIQPGILLYFLYKKTGEEKYKNALDTLVSIFKTYPRNKEGGFWHKSIRVNQMWLDGLYMGGPICAQYGSEFHKPEYFDMITEQIILMEKRTKDSKTGLWYHAYDEDRKMEWADKETGRSGYFWGRSIGWVPVALLEDLRFLPKEHKNYETVVKMLCSLLKAIVTFQDSKTGMWYQVVDKVGEDGNWPETSCTCLFTSAICEAVLRGYLDEDYLDYAKKGYEAVIGRLKEDSNGIILDNVCIGTGVGDYEYYCNRPTSENDLHGIGAFLLMCSSYEKIRQRN